MVEFSTLPSPLEEEVDDFPGPEPELLGVPELFVDGPEATSGMLLSREPLPRPRPEVLARPDEPEDEDELIRFTQLK